MDIPATQPVSRRLLTVPGITGIAYTLCWIAGVSVPAPTPKLAASGAGIAAAIAGHRTAVAAQIVLEEGLPAVGLAIVSVVLARAARRSGAVTAARFAAISGVAAAAISLLQFALGIVLAGTTAPGTAHLLYESVNRLDGAKMLTLAVLGVRGRRPGCCPGGCGTWRSRSPRRSSAPASPTCCSCRTLRHWSTCPGRCCWSSSPAPASCSGTAGPTIAA